ncbi:MAG: type II CAAX endopeptidase family protein [Parachlamydiales bacterium]|jgi:membrane protease YdiL (CAAX protease family)
MDLPSKLNFNLTSINRQTAPAIFLALAAAGLFFAKDFSYLWLLPLFPLLSKQRSQLWPLALFALMPTVLDQTAILFNSTYSYPFLHLFLPLVALWPFWKKLPPVGSFKLKKPAFQDLVLMLGITLASLFGLYLWQQQNSYSWQLSGSFRLLPRLVPLLALVNGFLEELSFRGVIQGLLNRLAGVFWLANGLQALWFGAMHFQNGFPSGWSGFGLCTAYALALGYVRKKTGSLAYCIIMHFAADLLVFYFLVSS